jgi:hypothetical protein
MQLTDTLGVIELVWLLFMGPGFLFSAWSVWEAIQDIRAVEDSGTNGLKKYLVTTSFRAEMNRATVLLLFLIVGISAALQEPPNAPPSITYLLTTILLFVAGLFTAGNSIFSYFARRRIRRWK